MSISRVSPGAISSLPSAVTHLTTVCPSGSVRPDGAVTCEPESPTNFVPLRETSLTNCVANLSLGTFSRAPGMLSCVKVNVEDVGSAAGAAGASTVVVAASDEVSANTGVTPATSDEVAIVAAVTQTTMRLLVSSRKNFDILIPFS